MNPRRPAVALLLVATFLLASPRALPATTAGDHAARQEAGGRSGSAPSGDDFETLRTGAEAARAAGRLDAAIDLYRRAVRLRPSWVEGHWYLGTSYYETSRYAACRDAFRTVVRLQAENGAARAFKGLCEFQLRDYEAALADLLEADRLGIGDDERLLAVTTYHRAILLTRFEQYERALRIYVDFARAGDVPPLIVEATGLAMLRMPVLPGELPPDRRDLVVRAGRAALIASGRMTGAAQQELAALAAEYPDVPNVHYAYGLLLLGEDPDRALAELKEELRVSPAHAPAMLQIAQELNKRGEIEQARPWAREAVRLAPRNFAAHRVLGQIQLAAGDLDGAIASLETAVGLEPNSPSAHFSLARAYQRAGRTADAARERAEFSRLERLERTRRGGEHAVGRTPATEDPDSTPLPR